MGRSRRHVCEVVCPVNGPDNHGRGKSDYRGNAVMVMWLPWHEKFTRTLPEPLAAAPGLAKIAVFGDSPFGKG